MSQLLGVVVTVLVAVSVAGCGVRPSGVVVGVEAPSGSLADVGRSLFFLAGNSLVEVRRPAATESASDVVVLLADGPDSGERMHGLSTAVPRSAAPSSVEVSSLGAEVSVAIAADLLSRPAVEQIVCTVQAQLGPPARVVTIRGGGHTLPERTCAA